MDENQVPATETAKPREGFSQYKLAVFVFCVIISALMWLFTELTKDYTDVVKYKLRFENVPDGLILTRAGDSTLEVTLSAQGFDLLGAKYLHRDKELVIDLSKVRIRSGAGGYMAYLPSARVTDDLLRQISRSKGIVAIKPDTLYFAFSEVVRKVVPVVAQFSYSLNSQYDLADSVKVNPLNLTVSGIQSVIDTLQFVRTQAFEAKNIDTSTTFHLLIEKSQSGQWLRYSADTIAVSLKVRKITEAEYEVPLTVLGDGHDLRIMPDKVKVLCRVPVSEFPHIESASFIAQVSRRSADEKRLKVEMMRVPPSVKILRVEPDEVDYVIIKP